MDKILSAYDFTIGQIQDIASLMIRMTKVGKDGHDLKAWVKQRAQEKSIKIYKCPQCKNGIMSVVAIEDGYEYYQCHKCWFSSYLKMGEIK